MKALRKAARAAQGPKLTVEYDEEADQSDGASDIDNDLVAAGKDVQPWKSIVKKKRYQLPPYKCCNNISLEISEGNIGLHPQALIDLFSL